MLSTKALEITPDPGGHLILKAVPPKKLGALQLETPLLSGVHEEQSAIRQLV